MKIITFGGEKRTDMEDIISIVFIIGMILVGFIKSTKDAKEEEAGHSQMPGRKNPLPENWGGEVIEMPATESASTPPPVPETFPTHPYTPRHTPTPRKKTVTPPPLHSPQPFFGERQGFTSRPFGKAQDKPATARNGARNKHDADLPPIGQQANTESVNSFKLDSAEEARRAIVWAEILQRKYV